MATYIDLNSEFRTNTAQSNVLVTDIQCVKESLERLLLTGKGEVPFNRNYGTTLKTLLFETNLDPADICNYLYMDITTWEPRVSLNPADIVIEQIDNNTYQVKCTFIVLGVNGNPQVVSETITNG